MGIVVFASQRVTANEIQTKAVGQGFNARTVTGMDKGGTGVFSLALEIGTDFFP